MEKKLQKNNYAFWILKALLASYMVTGVLLAILAFLLYKMNLDQAKVSAGIIVIYIISTFVGGLIIGKLVHTRRFLFGMLLGAIYFLLLLGISFGVYRTIQGNGTSIITAFILCAGGGMFGGMIS